MPEELFTGGHIFKYHLVEQIRFYQGVYNFRVWWTDQVHYTPWRNRAEIILHLKIFSKCNLA